MEGGGFIYDFICGWGEKGRRIYLPCSIPVFHTISKSLLLFLSFSSLPHQTKSYPSSAYDLSPSSPKNLKLPFLHSKLSIPQDLPERYVQQPHDASVHISQPSHHFLILISRPDWNQPMTLVKL